VTDDPPDDAADEPGSASSGPLLPPEDRIWSHPSEIAVEAATRVPGEGGHLWGTAAFSAVGGALAVGVIWLVIGAGEGRVVTERVSLTPVHTVSPRVVDADDWSVAVTANARDGTVSVLSGSTEATIAGAFTYRDDGYLLTSARAIHGQSSLTIVDANGVAHDAHVVGVDARTDVSVIRVDGGTGSAVIAETVALETGDKLAIVDPDGGAMEGTVTDAATHAATTDGDTVLGVVQLDSELGDIPPGSPVVDDTGAVVGMTTATDPNTTVALVPIDVARQIAGELIDDGVATHSWLGVTVRDIYAEEIQGGTPAGAWITSVTPGGPAATSGVLAGDIIVQVGHKPVDSVSAMVSALRYHEPGDEVGIRVDRDQEAIDVVVELGAIDEASG
jgi:S1-C subfamily serine protease